MQKRIIINSSAIETRVALCEANAVAELHVESGGEHSIVGNIYKGKVLRVLPGMQAAFVEMGLEKAAFMHVSDFWRAPGADGSDGPSGEMQTELDLEPSLAAYAEDLEADAITESAALDSAHEADARRRRSRDVAAPASETEQRRRRRARSAATTTRPRPTMRARRTTAARRRRARNASATRPRCRRSRRS